MDSRTNAYREQDFKASQLSRNLASSRLAGSAIKIMYLSAQIEGLDNNRNWCIYTVQVRYRYLFSLDYVYTKNERKYTGDTLIKETKTEISSTNRLCVF